MRVLGLSASDAATSASAPWTPERRMCALNAALGNTLSYYAQFEAAVKAAIVAGLAPHEKDLADFVQLAKWEDRGYYAMKVSTEKAQRHLHK